MGKIAFLFAGQGAQYPGMGQALYHASAAARQVFDLCERLRPGTLAQCFSGTKEELSRTVNTQPCLFAMDLACAQALREAGIEAQGAAGFSLGEVAAAAFCGVLSCEDAFRFVVERGERMDECARKNPGGMIAVLRLPAERVEALCREVGDAWPVNYNCPGQVAVAGREEALSRLGERVAQEKGRFVPLAVSGAFHSPLMASAAEALYESLGRAGVHEPALPLYANVTARPYGADGRGLLARQVKSPVLWQKTIENMKRDGYTVLIEAGAGKTLTGLVRKIDPALAVTNAETPEQMAAAKSWTEEQNA